MSHAAVLQLRTEPDLLPAIVTPEPSDRLLETWGAPRAALLDAALTQHGALLLRGFEVGAVDGLERFMRAISPRLVEYKERSTPRTRVGAHVYTSTEYPAHVDIPQHNENSYAATWPLRIAFYCETPAESGGETPLADSREVYRRLSPRTRDLFAARQVMYVRNYGLGVDLSWADAFQTDDPSAVEAYCRAAAIDWEWLDEGRRLRTRQVRPAVARHPATDDWLWFNQAHLFHTSSLDPLTRDALHGMYADEDLPRQALFGDGGAIPGELLDEVRAAYDAALRLFPWQRGDVLLLDNMLISHGRRAFRGTRQVFVVMASPWSTTRAEQAAV